MDSPSRDFVVSYRGPGNLVPVYRSILADLETPVSAYLKIASEPGSFLLESVEGGERLARYSFLGTNPYLVAELNDRRTRFIESGVERTEPFDNPLDVVRGELGRFRPVLVPGLPRFVGGAVGYLAYECARYFERLPAPTGAGLGVPEAVFLFVDTVLVFDHVRHRILIVSNVHLDDESEANRHAAYDQAVERIDRLANRLRRPLPDPVEKTPIRRGKGFRSGTRLAMASTGTFRRAVIRRW